MKYFLYDWAGLNAWIFHLINGIHGARYDFAMLALTRLGDHHDFVYYFAAIALLLGVQLLAIKMKGLRITVKRARADAALMIVLVMGYILLALVTGILKTLFHMPRPFQVYAPQEMQLIGVPAAKEYNASFPSGHAAFTCFIVTALWPLIPERARPPAALFAVLVCWSRVALGMHFPADVAYGALIGICCALLTRRYVYAMLSVSRARPKAGVNVLQ